MFYSFQVIYYQQYTTLEKRLILEILKVYLLNQMRFFSCGLSESPKFLKSYLVFEQL